ncbi:MAG TPA: hypothetical protein VK694_00395 [Verrucomicrobiae bacterium]|nr:hypothetical protein [Verrucomicrobiae bacterium]
MTPLIVLAAAACVPVVLALVFRVSAVKLFVSMSAGYLLVQFVGDDAGLAAGAFIRGANTPMATQIALLLAPTLFTLLLMRKSLPSSKLPLHILPLIAIGASLAVLTLPLVPSHIQKQVFDAPHGDVLRDAQDVAVALAAVLTLVLMWATGRNKEDKKRGKH